MNTAYVYVPDALADVIGARPRPGLSGISTNELVPLPFHQSQRVLLRKDGTHRVVFEIPDRLGE